MEKGYTEKGLIDAVNRIVSRLLDDERVVATIGVFLRNIDPESAPDLIRTLLWKKPDISLSTFSAAPALLNALLKALNELSVQMEKFSPGLLAGYLEGLIEDIDFEELGEATGRTLRLAAVVGNAYGKRDSKAFDDALVSFSRGYTGVNRQEAESCEKSKPEGAEGESVDDIAGLLASSIEKVALAVEREPEKCAQAAERLGRSLSEIIKENPSLSENLILPFAKAFRESGEG